MDALVDAFEEDTHTQTIFETERLATRTFDHGPEQTSNNSIKVYILTSHWVSNSHSYQQTLLLLLRKFCSL